MEKVGSEKEARAELAILLTKIDEEPRGSDIDACYITMMQADDLHDFESKVWMDGLLMRVAMSHDPTLRHDFCFCTSLKILQDHYDEVYVPSLESADNDDGTYTAAQALRPNILKEQVSTAAAHPSAVVPFVSPSKQAQFAGTGMGEQALRHGRTPPEQQRTLVAGVR